MNLLLIITLIFIVLAIFFFPYKEIRSANRKKNKKHLALKAWMKMTREQRNLLDIEQKKEAMLRKQSLINEIRKEYQNLNLKKRNR